MRGMFTAGVLDVLMEHDITVDGAIGVSAGAVFGCNYKSHQIGRTIRYNTQYCNDRRYASFKNLLRTGNLYSEQFCYHDVPEKLDPFDETAFAASPMDFFVVCTDVKTGEPIYHKCRTGDAEDVRWMEASASMPLAAKIVQIGHYGLLDGGIADSIPNPLIRIHRLQAQSHHPDPSPRASSEKKPSAARHPGAVSALSGLCGGRGRRHERYTRR